MDSHRTGKIWVWLGAKNLIIHHRQTTYTAVAFLLCQLHQTNISNYANTKLVTQMKVFNRYDQKTWSHDFKEIILDDLGELDSINSQIF